MKRIIYLLSLVCMLGSVGCSSDDSDPTSQVEPAVKGEKITIRVSIPERDNQSRVDFNDSDRSLTWEAADQLVLVGFNAAGYYVQQSDFTLIDGAGQNVASFEGMLIPEATQYKVYYKAAHLSIETEKGNGSIAYETQTQTANNSTAHLKGYMLISSGDTKLTTDALRAGNFKLHMENSIMRLNFKSMPAGNLGSLRAVYWTDDRETNNPLTSFVNTSFTPVSDEELIVFFCFNPTAMNADGRQYMQIRLAGSNEIHTAVYQLHDPKKRYVGGKRYFINVHTQETANGSTTKVFVWEKLAQKNTEIWVKVPEGVIPETHAQIRYKQEGTDYWTYKLKDSQRFDIERISGGLFEKMPFTEVIIPATVKEIGFEAFNICPNLEKVAFLPNSQLTVLKDEVFKDCSNLKEVTLPASLHNIGERCFLNCAKLDLTLPGSLEQIGNAAFSGCTNLTSINEIPTSVYRLGAKAFAGTGITSLTFKWEYSERLTDSCLEGMSSLQHLIILSSMSGNPSSSFIPYELAKQVNLTVTKRVIGYNLKDKTCFGKTWASIRLVEEDGSPIPNINLPKPEDHDAF